MFFMRTVIFSAVKSRWAAFRQSPLAGKKHNLLFGFVACRLVSTHHISKNIEVICHDDKPPTIEKPFSLQLEKTIDRPLLVILSWLFSKRKHVMKFANLYLEQGFDVVTVSVTPFQLMWPAKGTRLVAKDLLTFLDRNTSYQQIMLHGFSIGGYMWGELLDHVHEDREKYNHVIDRIVGQVWDSAADITELTMGTAKAVFPNNEMMQNIARKYLEYHLKTFHEQATRYYIRSSQLFHLNLVHTPALFLLSNADPVGAVDSNMRVRDSWDSLGTPTYVKIFEKSPHVGHFLKYPKEYVNEIYTFLDKLKMIKNEEKIRARIQA
ncbi:transmembrane protein 53-B [Cotesia glomerata]|uniref:Transmembrane protein 53 n=1 Tax=Cotesia glomerata TaxID=32391 RepID=A0AAV7IF56_COTGL|nr:transmembrane protein 53-B [Cotesia glomerata]XP_044577931.1 transmembrane protein 53-B [Cotesia glomerata]KAH0550394.1 hypothetical protein KQX54_019157 [Cotesia glomerata]